MAPGNPGEYPGINQGVKVKTTPRFPFHYSPKVKVKSAIVFTFKTQGEKVKVKPPHYMGGVSHLSLSPSFRVLVSEASPQ